MSETLSRDDFARMSVTLWAIWYARHKIIHKEVFQSPLSTHIFIESYLRDLAISYPSMKKDGASTRVSHPRWIRPESGCVKLNVDAVMAKNKPGGAVAIVYRSKAGSFMGASALAIPGISDPTVMETLTCREALSLAQDLQLGRVTVASDCLVVINALKQHFEGSFSMVIKEVQASARCLAEASFKHEYRASYSEAHRLACFTVSCSVGR
jgi:ribonuclease HI